MNGLYLQCERDQGSSKKWLKSDYALHYWPRSSEMSNCS